jgi:ABC-2 type transport system ATP-binding protein
VDNIPHGAAVTAVNFGVRGPRGWAFRHLGIGAEPGALIAVEGPSGSGRTAVLLALTGRMRAAEGHAEVAGLPLPRKMPAVRRISALGAVPGVSELDPALTVAEHLRERALLERRFSGPLGALLRPWNERRAEDRRRVESALKAAGLDLDTLPKGPRTAVRDLERLESLRLSVALALIARPRLLAVDDIDLKLSDPQREEAWVMLRSVARGGTTVLAVCSQAPEGAVVVSTRPGESPQPGPEGADTGDAAVGEQQDTGGREAGEAANEDSPAEDGTPHEQDERDPQGEQDEQQEKEAADAHAETGRA